jgi:hypothetical protein
MNYINQLESELLKKIPEILNKVRDGQYQLFFQPDPYWNNPRIDQYEDIYEIHAKTNEDYLIRFVMRVWRERKLFKADVLNAKFFIEYYKVVSFNPYTKAQLLSFSSEQCELFYKEVASIKEEMDKAKKAESIKEFNDFALKKFNEFRKGILSL